MTSKALGYILDSLAVSGSFTVPASLLDPHSKIDRTLLDGKALVRTKDFLSEIPCPYGCGSSEPVRKGVKDGKPFYHGRCATLKKYWTVPPEEVELLTFDKAAFEEFIRSGKIEMKDTTTPPPNFKPVLPPPKEDPNALVHLVQKTISDKRGMKYNLAQIEMDILFALPERSPWQFVRVLRLMETTVFNATSDFDPDLSQRRWFREGLLILADSPYANRPRSEQDVAQFKDELCEGLASFLITLVKWRHLREKSEHFAEHKGDALTRAIQESFAKMPTDLERTEKIKKYLYRYLIYDDGGIVRYHGGPFISLLEACMGTGRPSIDDVPKDVRVAVSRDSAGFYECNYGGWTDSTCDEWIEKTITTIDLARQRNERNHPEEWIERQQDGVQGNYSPVIQKETGDAILRKLDEITQNQKIGQEEIRGALEANTKATTNLGRKVDAAKSDVKTVATGLAKILPDLGACTAEEAGKAFGLIKQYVGLDKIPSTVHRSQVKAAIDYSHKEGVAVHMPKQNGTTKHPTVTDLAKTVWDINEEKWEQSPDSYKTLTDYTSALQHHFSKYPDSLLHCTD